MKRVFADAYFFFAFLSSRDSAHGKAVDYFTSFDGTLITTEAVLTEVGDGLASPGDRSTFVELYGELRSDPEVKIVSSDPNLFAAALDLYRSRPDKKWSLTDCISFVVMNRENLTDALTGDHHFEQAGFRPLLK